MAECLSVVPPEAILPPLGERTKKVSVVNHERMERLARILKSAFDRSGIECNGLAQALTVSIDWHLLSCGCKPSRSEGLDLFDDPPLPEPTPVTLQCGGPDHGLVHHCCGGQILNLRF